MREKSPDHILVLRFSALGDVAIASPLLKAYAADNPGTKFTMVSLPMLRPLFEGAPNISFFPTDFKGRHKGLKGLLKLHKELIDLSPTAVADINSVLRTFILRVLFFISFTPLSFLRKGRVEKKKLTRRYLKNLRPLMTTLRRYELVLISLGLKDINFASAPATQPPHLELIQPPHPELTPLHPEPTPLYPEPTPPHPELTPLHPEPTPPNPDSINQRAIYKIGVAPFANHRGKIWPPQQMERLIEMLSEDERFSVTLFGGGKKEIAILKSWELKYSGVKSVAGELSFSQELDEIAGRDLMLTMDSANMHFACCMRVPVISIWGATHPYLGFYGWGQDSEMALQSSIECRPCSSSGNKECFRGDYACLNEITPDIVFNKILNFFEQRL